MSRYGDGSSDALGTIVIVLLGIISLVLLVVGGLGGWLHGRSEARKDAACERLGGTRIETDSGAYCISKAAIIGAKQ